MTRFILASASPARLQTLRNAGVDPEVIVSGVDEDHVTAPSPGELARTLATLKARAVVSELDGHATVLGCDSVLEIDGVAYGKPGTPDEARARLRAMSGSSGVLHTGHCLFDTSSRVELRELASTKVFFATLTEEEIEAYVGTGEPLAVAGSFTVDGLGGAFVEGIDGDHHNVVGISLPLVRRMLAEVGITWTSLWKPSIEYDEAEAERYDDTRGGADRARAAAEAVDRLLEDKGRVLDLAVGTGIVAAELAALGHLVHGVDVSAAMLQRAAIRLPGHVAQADAGVLPIADLRCDAVTAIWLLHLVPDSDALLAEVARILKPGGLFVTTVDKNDSSQVARGNPPNRVRAQDSLAYLASRAPVHGLVLESATTFPGPGHIGNAAIPVYPLVAFRRPL
ncbi:Maf family nucleotide pyrophosphatase [Kribbella sp. NBC_01245]|uniref:Maf family nucleotide pyrophosphatase n=1 Tax=Kribbella sp. NBC_01245 TaxID=2903578 RepID=UPI002E2D7352|nr:Maf family nucleotide pyrophosphatase [Kribbella sp. NBC_01245]